MHCLPCACHLPSLQGNESAAAAVPEAPLVSLRSASSSSELIMPFIPADITPAIERLLQVGCSARPLLRPSQPHCPVHTNTGCLKVFCDALCTKFIFQTVVTQRIRSNQCTSHRHACSCMHALVSCSVLQDVRCTCLTAVTNHTITHVSIVTKSTR